jgi:glycosyltransferase involved in cell wall biosynthesis
MVQPLVSVIIPAFNAATYIRQTVKAVQAQTFKDSELIIVNDGSPDTAELESELSDYRNVLKYFHQPNRGAAAARNLGLRIAAGRYAAFLDADDAWFPSYLEEQLTFLGAHPDVDLVYADARLAGDSPLAGRTFMQTAPSRGSVTVESLLSLRCHVINSGVVARRSKVLEAGGFDESIRRGHDFDLWVRLAHRGARIAYQRKVLLTRHIHLDSLSGDALSECERCLTGLERIDRSLRLTAAERAALTSSVAWLKARIELERGKQLFRTGDVPAAIAAVSRANRLHPQLKLRAIALALRIAPWSLQQLDRIRRRRVVTRSAAA